MYPKSIFIPLKRTYITQVDFGEPVVPGKTLNGLCEIVVQLRHSSQYTRRWQCIIKSSTILSCCRTNIYSEHRPPHQYSQLLTYVVRIQVIRGMCWASLFICMAQFESVSLVCSQCWSSLSRSSTKNKDMPGKPPPGYVIFHITVEN